MIDFTQLSDTVTKAVDGVVKQLDVTKIDLTKLDLRTTEMPTFEMPTFEMPEINVPAEAARITALVRDVTYAGIGVGVIAVQRVDAEVRKLVGTSA